MGVEGTYHSKRYFKFIKVNMKGWRVNSIAIDLPGPFKFPLYKRPRSRQTR